GNTASTTTSGSGQSRRTGSKTSMRGGASTTTSARRQETSKSEDNIDNVLLQDFNLWFGNQEQTKRGYIVDMYRQCAPQSFHTPPGELETRAVLASVDDFLQSPEGADHQSYLFFRHKHTYMKLTNLHLKISYEDLRCIIHCIQWQMQSLSRLWQLEEWLGGQIGSATSRPGEVLHLDQQQNQQGSQSQPASQQQQPTTLVPIDRYRSHDLQIKSASLELLNDCGQEVAYPFFRLDLTRVRTLSESMSFFDRSIFKTRTVHKTSRGLYVDFYAEYFNPVAVCYEPLCEGLDLFGEKQKAAEKFSSNTSAQNAEAYEEVQTLADIADGPGDEERLQKRAARYQQRSSRFNPFASSSSRSRNTAANASNYSSSDATGNINPDVDWETASISST
ncbi:unnamed protein product, partial [Amoebophrya sp. A120]